VAIHQMNTTNTTTSDASITVSTAYDIERIVFIMGTSLLIILSTLQLSCHFRDIYAGSPRPWIVWFASRQSVAPAASTSAAAAAAIAAVGNKQTFIIPLVKGELHLAACFCTLCMLILCPDPSTVYDILPAIALSYCVRVLAAVLLLSWGRWFIGVTTVRYKDLGRAVPRRISLTIKIWSYTNCAGSIVFPTLVVITGWQVGTSLVLHLLSS
jgi:hypothetical protein